MARKAAPKKAVPKKGRGREIVPGVKLGDYGLGVLWLLEELVRAWGRPEVAKEAAWRTMQRMYAQKPSRDSFRRMMRRLRIEAGLDREGK